MIHPPSLECTLFHINNTTNPNSRRWRLQNDGSRRAWPNTRSLSLVLPFSTHPPWHFQIQFSPPVKKEKKEGKKKESLQNFSQDLDSFFPFPFSFFFFLFAIKNSTIFDSRVLLVIFHEPLGIEECHRDPFTFHLLLPNAPPPPPPPLLFPLSLSLTPHSPAMIKRVSVDDRFVWKCSVFRSQPIKRGTRMWPARVTRGPSQDRPVHAVRVIRTHLWISSPCLSPAIFHRDIRVYSDTEEGEGRTCSPVTYYSWSRRSKFKILDASGE